MKARFIEVICNASLFTLAFLEFMLVCSFAEGHFPLLNTLGFSAAFWLASNVLAGIRAALCRHSAEDSPVQETSAAPDVQSPAPSLRVVHGGHVA